MGFIPDLKDVPELTFVEPGEYDLIVKKAKEQKSKKTKREGFQLVLEFTEEENCHPIFHNLWFPMSTDDEEKANTMLRMLKEFIIAIGLDADGDIELEEFEDVTFTGQVEVIEDEYGTKHELKRVTG